MKIHEIKVLPKPGESIHFKNNRVTKHFDDAQIIKDRVERAKILKGIVPEIIAVTEHSYTYEFIPGNLLSEETSVEIFKKFLEFCEKKMWSKKYKATNEFYSKCRKFYFDKTLKRLEKFYKDTKIKDRSNVINGTKVPTLKTLLNKIDWDLISKGLPALFHGDLQPENILVTKNGFKLIDWRHEFEGLKEYGDIYYDFAKLYHALLISNEVIRNGQYKVAIKGGIISYEFLVKSNLLQFERVFDEWLTENGYDLKKVKVLTALIYLNIAPLYSKPYNKLLYFLGKSSLYHALYARN